MNGTFPETQPIMQIYKTISQITSYLLHPLLMPTYALLLLLTGTFLSVYPLRFKLIYLLGVMLFTLMAPVSFILMLRKKGYVDDADISNRKQRLIPYLFTIVCYLGCLAFLYKTVFPLWGLSFFFGASAALALNLVINVYWKISAHLTGMGGLTGCVLAVCWLMNLNPTGLFVGLILASGVLATSRIYLGHHTPMQVLGGYVCGFVTIFASIMGISRLF